MWKNIDEEELLEMQRLILHFLVSSVYQRLTHVVFEVKILISACYTCYVYNTMRACAYKSSLSGRVINGLFLKSLLLLVS